MSKKSKKKKKKVSAKKERYSKFRKDKSTDMTFAPPDLTEDQNMQRKKDEDFINRFLRYRKNPPAKEVSERKMRSKR